MSHFIQINPGCFMINHIKIYSCYFQALANCCTIFLTDDYLVCSVLFGRAGMDFWINVWFLKKKDTKH